MVDLERSKLAHGTGQIDRRSEVVDIAVVDVGRFALMLKDRILAGPGKVVEVERWSRYKGGRHWRFHCMYIGSFSLKLHLSKMTFYEEFKSVF